MMRPGIESLIESRTGPGVMKACAVTSATPAARITLHRTVTKPIFTAASPSSPSWSQLNLRWAMGWFQCHRSKEIVILCKSSSGRGAHRIGDLAQPGLAAAFADHDIKERCDRFEGMRQVIAPAGLDLQSQQRV